MNICQISSYDLLMCLQSGDLEQSSFFQQVLSIAQAGHLVCISDYAIGPFLQTQLPEKVQQQLDSLLDVIDVWATSPQSHQQADELSTTLAIPLADAIDCGIYEDLCPDWLLVEELGRSLPNAASIQEFWQEWRSIQDDLPPSGGLPIGKFPTGGSPNDAPGKSDKPSQSQKITSDANLLASNSVVFSHRNAVSWSMGLYYVNHPKPIATPISTQLSTTDWIASHPTFRAQTQKSNPATQPNNIQIGVAARTDAGQATTSVILLTQAGEIAPVHSSGNPSQRTIPQFQLAEIPEFLIQASPEVLAVIAQTVQNLAVQNQVTQNQILQGTSKNDVLIAGAGNDVLVGGGGADFLNGSAGVDTASYGNANSGVIVSLATGLGTAGEAKGDRLKNIENLEGSNFADTLVGDRADNVLMGRAGNDTIVGGLGNDILQGGTGNNILFGDNPPVPFASLPASNPIAIATPSQPPTNSTFNPTPTADPAVVPMPTIPNLPFDAVPSPSNPSPSSNISDWIFAGSGDDVIDAGDGNNFIDAGAGDNQVESGNGRDLFVLSLGSGVTTIAHYQHHDRFGLIGGVAYEDLTIQTMEPSQTGLQSDSNQPVPKLRVKISVNRNGVEDVLAIVVGVTPDSLNREAFLTIQYQQQSVTALPPAAQPGSIGPQRSTQGATQVIPDWLSVSGRSSHLFQVPSLGQLAPNLVVLDPSTSRWAA